MAIKNIEYRSLIFDINKLSISLAINNPNLVKEIFNDGRAISRFSEHWAADLFGFTKTSGDTKGFDLVDKSGYRYEVKSLTRQGTAIRRSSNTGAGRKCSNKDVMSCIGKVEGFVLVDNTEFPSVTMYKINSEIIEDWVVDGTINKNNGQVSYEKIIKKIKELLIKESVKTRSKINDIKSS